MEKTTSQLLFAETLQRLTNDLVRYAGLLDRVCTENLNITGSQGYTLLAMPEGESISMNDLSLKMKLAGSTMTRTVDPLVKKGLVDRQPDAEDRRVVRVRLTETGLQAKQQLQETLQWFFSSVMAEIPEGERAQVIQSLERLNGAIINALQCCFPTTDK
jgi:DNA-binding MarR family transcriptional regulator